MSEERDNLDRLVLIIANYVGVNKLGFEELAVLDGLFDALGPSERLRAFWDDRFARALARAGKEA